jgi:SAM-dependent methyltransferase
VANSADNPSADDSLDMDKDVPVEGNSEEEVDELALDMPEFKVPTGRHDALTEEQIEAAASEAAANTDVESHADDEGPNGGFDREELVRTMRMDAFDRSQIELEDAVSKWEVSDILRSQKYAPDVLIGPPRVLTVRWQDGPGVGSDESAGPHKISPEDRKSMASTVRTTPLPEASNRGDVGPSPAIIEEPHEEADEHDDYDDDFGEATDILPDIPEDSFELDSEAIVDEPESKPPPVKPTPPPARQQPGRQRRSTRPLQKADGPSPSLQKQVPAPDASESAPHPTGDDDDLSGIVQELLEEKKPAPKRPSTPQDRRANWFVDVFSDEYLRTLPPNLHERTEKEVKFILDSLSLKQGARLLDLACGFGRHSIQLAKRGYEVAGLDLSMALLQRALNEAQRRSLSIKFIHGDMRELNFSEIFDACFCWETSFGYFDDRTNVEVLKGIHRALKPGGRLLIDVVNRDYVVAEMPSRTWWEGVECVFLEEVEFDYNTSLLHTKRSYIYEDGSPPKEFSSYIRLYGLHELRTILRFSGFRILEVSGEVLHRGAYLGPASSRTIVLAERVGGGGGRKG